MKTRALILCCLLTVPAVRAQQDSDAGAAGEDPFEFLKDDSNTQYTKPPQSTAPAAAEPAPVQSAPAVTQSADEDPFEFLLDDSNTVFTGATPGSKIPPGKGEIRFGLQYVTDDNFTLGRYNGLDEEGFVPILDIDYGSWQQDPESGEQPLFWSARLQDGFTDVQEGDFTIGRRNHFRVTAMFDQQQQVNNDSGATPFDSKGNLPANWVPSNITSGMTMLDDSLSGFNQKL